MKTFFQQIQTLGKSVFGEENYNDICYRNENKETLVNYYRIYERFPKPSLCNVIYRRIVNKSVNPYEFSFVPSSTSPVIITLSEFFTISFHRRNLINKFRPNSQSTHQSQLSLLTGSNKFRFAKSNNINQFSALPSATISIDPKLTAKENKEESSCILLKDELEEPSEKIKKQKSLESGQNNMFIGSNSGINTGFDTLKPLKPNLEIGQIDFYSLPHPFLNNDNQIVSPPNNSVSPKEPTSSTSTRSSENKGKDQQTDSHERISYSSHQKKNIFSACDKLSIGDIMCLKKAPIEEMGINRRMSQTTKLR